ncbi:MAG TPA: hypothetical protein VGP72_22645 [Planctomycetota bacterium]
MQIDSKTKALPMAISYSPDERSIVVSFDNCMLGVFDLRTQKLLYAWYGGGFSQWDREHVGGLPRITAVAFTLDGSRVVTVDEWSTTRSWTVDGVMRSELTFEGRPKLCPIRIFSADGNQFGVAEDGIGPFWLKTVPHWPGEGAEAHFPGRPPSVSPNQTYMLMANGIWSRRRPEHWWGLAWLPEFWLTLLFSGALVWSVRRDRRELRPKEPPSPLTPLPRGGEGNRSAAP